MVYVLDTDPMFQSRFSPDTAGENERKHSSNTKFLDMSSITNLDYSHPYSKLGEQFVYPHSMQGCHRIYMHLAGINGNQT